MVIQWSKNAEYQFQEAIAYILLYSTKYAYKVKTEIIELIKTLTDHPERFPLDKFKRNNDGSFRALELHH